MGSFLIAVGGRALQFLFGSGGNIADTSVRDALVQVWAIFDALGTFLNRLFGREKGAMEFAHPQIIGGAEGLGDTAYANMVSWTRLLDVILPGSLRWLDGHTHRWVDAKYDPQLTDIFRRLSFLYGWRGQIDHWRRDQVDPELAKLMHFRRWYLGWPDRTVASVHAWLIDPALFGRWAAAPIARPLLDHLAERKHLLLRRQLTALMVDTSPEVFRHVELAMARMLEAPAS